MKNTKIIVTVGPASLHEKSIKKMHELGVDLFRINLSHTKLEDIEKVAIKLRQWTDKPICFDTEGAQLRTGEMPNERIEFHRNETVIFVHDTHQRKEREITLALSSAFNLLHPGDILKIDFQGLTIHILEVTSEKITARVLNGGIAKSNKGISVDRGIYFPPFTPKDIAAFEIAKSLNIKDIALSFTSSKEDVCKLRSFFNYPIHVISKVESRLALDNLDGIINEADSILIDRGDLSRDVPLERIIAAQRYILKAAAPHSVPVFIATNLMESMIGQNAPTRAEVHDIVSSLDSGASGLVLAAETAIGKYPVECVIGLSKIIKNYEVYKKTNDREFLFDYNDHSLVTPHGGRLISQHFTSDIEQLKTMRSLTVSEDILSDVLQICEGTYSPIDGFMDMNALTNVLLKNQYTDGSIWTLPILMQVSENIINSIGSNEEIRLISELDNECYAILKVNKIEKISSMIEIAKQWFGTDDPKHPGVDKFFKQGPYILSGKPFLIKKPLRQFSSRYELCPKKTRSLFHDLGWQKIVGFHTRNVAHRGHEYIQKKALEITGADGIFISPVVGTKKKGDFDSLLVLRCYEELIRTGVYNPFGAILGAFNTYSRYSGPREAIFTAICRKNFGCSDFIVGRDHTGVGNFYAPDESIRFLKKFDLGINIVSFGTVSYCDKCNGFNETCSHSDTIRQGLSGTALRDFLVTQKEIPDFLIRPEIKKVLKYFETTTSQDLFV